MNTPGGWYGALIPLHTAAVATADGATVKVASRNGGAIYVGFSVEGISGDTITFEGTMDGTNWYAIMTTNLTTGSDATTATADGIYRANVACLLEVRARLTRSAGTVTVKAGVQY